jgi:hypothetical protein
MTWIVARYHPISLFSLRPHHATTSGGKTLITPTAYAIKMALLNAAIQTAGLEEGKRRFSVIRDLKIAISLPDELVVIKSFAKVLREAEFKGKATEREAWEAEQRDKQKYPFAPTIAYRELVQFGGPLQIALTTPDDDPPSWLADAFIAVNYLGKRGSFMQIAGQPEMHQELSDSFIEITQDSISFAINGTMQMLDDCGAAMTFAHADIYDSKRITLGKERVIRHVVLPYRLVRSSRGYSLYERIRTEGLAS